MSTHAAGSGDRVLLYVRAGCHLCESARDVVAAAAAESGDGWSEVDIETAPAREPLVERYGELVPVVTVDGVQQGFWRIDAARLRRALAGGRG